jgi:hypothetical protein
MKRTLKRESKVLEIVGGEALEAGRSPPVAAQRWERSGPMSSRAPARVPSRRGVRAEPLRVRPGRRAGVGWPGGRGTGAAARREGNLPAGLPPFSDLRGGRGTSREHTLRPARDGAGRIRLGVRRDRRGREPAPLGPRISRAVPAPVWLGTRAQRPRAARLETRTKESDACASSRVANPLCVAKAKTRFGGSRWEGPPLVGRACTIGRPGFF